MNYVSNKHRQRQPIGHLLRHIYLKKNSVSSVSIFIFALIATGSSGCESQDSCIDSGLSIIAHSRDINSIELSGPACDKAQIHTGFSWDEVNTDKFVPKQELYKISPNAGGDCTIKLVLTNGDILQEKAAFRDYRNNETCPGITITGEDANGNINNLNFFIWDIDVYRASFDG